jgi:hypothetical protein
MISFNFAALIDTKKEEQNYRTMNGASQGTIKQGTSAGKQN